MVNITQTPINISTIMDRLENDEYDLTPAFQRHGNLWDKKKQSQLIESLMLKIPLPAFYFDASKEDEWIVIDGLQRLTAFKNYLVGNVTEDGKIVKHEFQGLQYLTDFNGKTFDDLPRQYIRRIKESSIVAYTVAKGTPEAIVFNFFQRINTGGVQLNDQEIRQALYSGKGTELIKELAERQEFKIATQYAIKPERMLDREYVLRFLSFTELDYKQEYRGNIDSFLIKGLKKINGYSDTDIERVTDNFLNVMNACHNIFGKFAFRKYNKDFHRGPINKAIFELWAICFSELNADKLNKIITSKEEVLTRFGDLLLGNKPTINEQVRWWMDMISPGVSPVINMNPSSRTAELQYEYIEGRNKTNSYKSINVGFGITYVLPVIVTLVAAKPGDIILIENPEAHIHPRGQRVLGELIAAVGSGGVQVIVETHSDHVLNGIRVSVKKGKLEAEKTGIYYFYKDDSFVHQVQRIFLDANGRLDEWPIGFFDEWNNALLELL